MLSIVVNFFNNRREARNTLYSLTRKYQRVDPEFRYEVIAIDNGSSEPLAADDVRGFGAEFSHRYVETDSVSPVQAINAACRESSGDQVMVIIDGAHIVSPGVLNLARDAFALAPASFVATVSFHLGPKQQNLSVSEGYNQQVEDDLLQRLAWKDDGYRLFAGAGSFSDGSLGWFGCLFESGCFALRKSDYLSMGGYDERFQSRGGGLANLDFFRRAVSRTDLRYVLLLGEGTFHQVHGGVASNASPENRPWNEFNDEYQRLTGKRYERVPRLPFYLGSLSRHALAAARTSANMGLELWQKLR